MIAVATETDTFSSIGGKNSHVCLGFMKNMTRSRRVIRNLFCHEDKYTARTKAWR